VLGSLLAKFENPALSFHGFYFILTAVGCMSAHAGANMLSDYYDYKHHVDREGTYGSSGVLVQKLLQPVQVLRASWIALILAGLIGLYFICTLPNGLFLLYLILIGGILGVFYTAGPIEFKYRALGDIAVFISFGPAMVLGAYFVQAGHFSWSPVLYSLPVALLVDAILHSNNLRDIQNDSVIKIKTFAIVIGEKNAKIMYYSLIFGAYVLVLIMVAFKVMPWPTVACMISLPMAIKLARMVNDKDKIPVQQFAMIDALTAQLHSAFSVLMIVALLVQYFFIR
jgi:1,4-dihydroxy-2-naphthoate octaprenyltransferase